MSMVRKLHPQLVRNLREFLSENNISTKKLVIDLEAETIEDFDDYSVDDILSVAGILKPGEAQELLEHIQESREGWRK
ncbi:hypothetical protein PV433_25250 [Paenibacillus sp. GYB004]|uniref:hypothetical protein n=1 Tax=Paenibacillus sp. GYB004 TaxID=2994393 RepID=UPI002F96750F